MENVSFSDMFEECSVENITTTSSDHYAVLISLAARPTHLVRPAVQQGFRYEAVSRRAKDYSDVVKEA
jgi:hypothetical protein